MQEAAAEIALLAPVALCGGKTRKGTPCQSPAVARRKRCRMHGATSPGAPKGEANGNYRTGRFTAERVAQRQAAVALLRAWARLADEL